MWLTAGSQYELDGLSHTIPVNEKVVGIPPLWNQSKATFLTRLKGLLREFHERTTTAGIPYYISCGTLLGAVKMKGFLPADTDADVSVMMEDIPRLKEALKNGPFQLTPFRYGLKLCVNSFPYYPFVDIMPVAALPHAILPEQTEKVYAFCYPLDAEGNPTFELRYFFNKKKHPTSLLYPLKLYDFEGLQLWGPSNGEEMCRRAYGEACFNTTTAKYFRKHCISGLTATWGDKLCRVFGRRE